MKNIFRKITNIEHYNIVVKYCRKRPVPLGTLAKELGISVYLSAVGAGFTGHIKKIEESYCIKINRFEPRYRQRFTLVHEILHFLLHQHLIDEMGIKDNVQYRSNLFERVESEVNKLVAELFLPSARLKKDLEECGREISEKIIEHLAYKWQVSTAMMIIKLRYLIKANSDLAP